MFVLSKILSSLWWLSIIEMLGSTANTQLFDTSAFEIFLIISSLCSIIVHTSLAKGGGVVCLLDSSQFLDSKSDQYSVIHNCLTTYSNSGLWYTSTPKIGKYSSQNNFCQSLSTTIIKMVKCFPGQINRRAPCNYNYIYIRV